MPDSDGHLKPMPIAEFEGEYVRTFEAKLPGITMDMAEGYMRGTHVVFEVESRVRHVGYNEDKNGDLTRVHTLTLEEVRLKEAFDPAHRPTNVGGNSAGDAWIDQLVAFLEGEENVLDFDGEQIPERLREMLKIYFDFQPAAAQPTISAGIEVDF